MVYDNAKVPAGDTVSVMTILFYDISLEYSEEYKM